jgi:hypothetical protein
MRAASTEIAAVAAADRTDAIGSLTGALLVTNSLEGDQWQANSNGTPIADTTAVTGKAHTDNYYTVVTALLITNSDATVGTNVQILGGTGTVCGTGGSVLWEGYAAPAGGGFSIGNGQGPLFTTAAVSNDICVKAVTTSAEVYWSIKGYRTKSLTNNP